MKRIFLSISVLVAVLATFIYYIGKNISTIEHTVNVTLSQSLGYIALAFGFVLLSFYFLILMNKKSLQIVGIQRSMTEAALLRAQALAINVLVPSGGVSVGMIFARDAKKHDDSEAAAVTGVILALLADYAAILVLMVIAMLYLASLGTLGYQIIVPALAFFALAVGLSLLIFLAGKKKQELRKLLNFLRGKLGKFVKDETLIDHFIDELASAYDALRADRRHLYLACTYALISHLMALVSIYILFLSLGVSPLYRVLVAGYAVGVMLIVISPTPNGVGFVEGAMALAYTSLGIPGAAAATATLIYRGLSFWFPLFVGFFALQRRHWLDLVASGK